MRVVFVYGLQTRKSQLWNLDGINVHVGAVFVFVCSQDVSVTAPRAEITCITILWKAANNKW